LLIRFFFFLGIIQTSKATEQDVRVTAQKKFQYCHRLKYLAAEKPFSTFYVANQVEGADQG